MLLERFEMVDRVEQLDLEAAAIRVRASVPEHSSVFEGHFPGYPLVPGVLLIEAMAQASGYLLLALNGLSRMPFLASVKAANFRTMVLPGAILQIEARREHDGSGYAVMAAKVHTENRLAADANMMLRIVEFPNAALEACMRERAARLGFGGGPPHDAA
jgi:3-hydroxyacyl-[acyl-carrier-protein] dehydratase